MHARGHHDGLGGGTYIGLPPIMNFGTPAIKEKVIPEVLSAKKQICLCISEAFAGSDVAGLRTTAVKSADGKYYTVTGTKKVRTHVHILPPSLQGSCTQWITSGHYADYVSIRLASTYSIVT